MSILSFYTSILICTNIGLPNTSFFNNFNPSVRLSRFMYFCLNLFRTSLCWYWSNSLCYEKEHFIFKLQTFTSNFKTKKMNTLKTHIMTFFTKYRQINSIKLKTYFHNFLYENFWFKGQKSLARDNTKM